MELYNTELYDLQLKYIETVNENLVCPICCQPFIDPVISPCKHYFCKRCIVKALAIKEECPIDRLKLYPMELLEAPSIIINMLNETPVFCPNKNSGCDFKTQRQLLSHHLKDCTKSGNDLDACLKESESSLKDICPHCQSEIPKNDLISHILICDELVIACRCHRFGCDWKGPKKEIEAHNIACSYLKIEPFLENQNSRVSALEKENSELRSLIQSFHTGLETVTEQVSDISQPISGRQVPRPNQEHNGTNDNSLVSRYFSDELPAASLERVRADHQRLRFELMSLSSQLGSMELKQNLALTTECLSLRDELQDLRFSVQALKFELDDLSRERQNTLSALAALAKSASNRASRTTIPSQGKPSKLNDYKL